MSKLRCDKITKTYKEFTLQSTSFTIESGYLTALIGLNGAGKSTLLRCLSGLDMNFGGDANVDGMSLKNAKGDYQNEIGVVSDEITYFMEYSAFENGERLGRYFKNWSTERYYYFMDRMDFSPSKPLYQLSKGEYMKMQTCFSLAHKPKFLIMDEPLEGFDPVFRKEFFAILQDVLNDDTGILLSSHITESLDTLADYIMIMKNGMLTIHNDIETLQDALLKGEPFHKFHIKDLLSRDI